METAFGQLEERGITFITEAALEQPRDRLIDAIGIGIIVCNGAGVVQFASRCAEDELAVGTLLCRVGQTVRCLGTSTPSLEAAIGMAERKGSRHLLEISHAGDRLLVSVAPWRRPAPEESLVIVLLGRRVLCSPLTLELLSSINGLTLAERRVLADLLRERTPREIATLHGVALTTVRTQIASIQTKLGVHGVAALLLRLAEAPPVPGPPRDAPYAEHTTAHPQAAPVPTGAHRH